MTPEQRKVLSSFLREARRRGASPKELKALVEAGLVESGLRNLNYGDRDSVGALQQRPSQGWQNALNPQAAAGDFLSRARQANRSGTSAGQLAQAVQRSAFPGRYDEQAGQAEALLGGNMSAQAASNRTRTIPGVDRSDQRKALLLEYLQESHDPDALLRLKGGLDSAQDTPSRTVTERVGGGDTKGKSNLLELFYNGPGGVNVKNGRVVPRGFVSGHEDHVHVAAGPKTVVRLGKLAQRMGLHVGENPHFGGVEPVHAKGSYHYRDEAIDVSGDPQLMAEYARRVARMFGAR